MTWGIDWSYDSRYLCAVGSLSTEIKIYKTSAGLPPNGGLVEVANFGQEAI